MSNLWATATQFDPQVMHDEDQGFHRELGAAISEAGYHAKPSYAPRGERPRGMESACPGDGSCLQGHSIPLEAGYGVNVMHHNGRLDMYPYHTDERGNQQFIRNAPIPKESTGIIRQRDVLPQRIRDYMNDPDLHTAIVGHARGLNH